ncbi:MAG TPA: cation-transporting P-type ATPase [Verrucomicrobiae bacterium]|nr:cation-transporting P-type ATPase [Verrucomicrobiae bacterium]
MKTDAINWHQLQTEEVVQFLEADLRAGLSADEVRKRQAQFGPNRLTGARRISAWWRFLQQFAQPLMYILLIAVGVTSFLSEWVDAAVIFGVVVVNALVGFIQESKAEKAIEALSQMVTTEATVRRDGRKQRVNSVELVPGDVVLLQSGDKVPADVRLFHVRSLQVDESALTGESVPVQKHADPLVLDTILAERKNLAFAGTLVTYGQAEGVVWAIGNQTETGRIARLIHEAVDLSTPLTRKIAQFSRLVLWVIMVLAALTFLTGWWRGGEVVEMFMASVALAVGAIPEGLPAAVTITLAIGVARMARRRAIIRKLPAVESLGSTTVICSDKTGTLTENQMTVQKVFAGGRYYEITGSGYEAAGEVRLRGKRVVLEHHAGLRETLLAGLLNNDSQLVTQDGRLKVEGDPTEAALIVVARKAGLLPAEQQAAHPRLDVIPFESEHQFMATLHGRGEGRLRVIYKKGSIERLLERCTHALRDDGELDPLDREAVRAAADEMAAQGLRVLAFARREVAHDHHRLHHEHVREGLTFLGLQAMIDPPRAEAITSIRKCQEAGIQVKMITGDHALTASAIARQLGLRGGDHDGLLAVTGRELEKVSETELPALTERAAVFARVAPEQKLKLVKALQARGHIVAMTGDGVNDAPALKQADIGVAMGITGTDVAKGAADMLLTDDNFASIEAAVEEGRGVFDNLTKFIVWTLPTNAGEALILLTAIFLGTALPALPVQLLWINMTTAILLGLMLVFEPHEKTLMQRPPRDPRLPIITYPVFMRTGLVTLLMLAGGFGLFLYERRVLESDIATARTVVVNLIIMVEAFYLLNCRSLLHSPWSIGFFANRWVFLGLGLMAGAQLLFTHLPLMNRLFHSAPLDGAAWLRVAAVGLAVFCIVEFEKWIRLKFGHEESADVARTK